MTTYNTPVTKLLYRIKCWNCEQVFYMESTKDSCLVCPHCEYSNGEDSVTRVRATLEEEL